MLLLSDDAARLLECSRGPAPRIWGCSVQRLLSGLLLVVSLTAPFIAPRAALAAPDFTLTLAPTSQSLAPGGTANLLVSIGSLGGYNTPVTLTAIGLPSGVTAAFAPTSVVPSGSATLKLTATSAAAIGTFPVTVSATDGTTTRTASGSLMVNFGLVPLCFGAFSGVVTDSATGLPVANASVLGSATTDSFGRYTISNVPLLSDGSPETYSVSAQATNYWQVSRPGTAACGQVTTVDLAMIRQQTGTIGGKVVVGVPDPNDLTANRAVTPTNTPIAGAAANLDVPYTTGADGIFKSGPLPLDFNNAPKTWNFQVQAAGYWLANVTAQLTANQNSSQTIALVQQCTGTISGTVTLQDTGQPAANSTVLAGNSPWALYRTTTDAQGRYQFAKTLLGYNNASARYDMAAKDVPNYQQSSASTILARCGDSVNVDIALTPSIVPNFGTVDGFVYDADTGLPVNQACVGFGAGCLATTDATGYYKTVPIEISSDSSKSSVTDPLTAQGGVPLHWDSGPIPVLLVANKTTRQDFRILLERFGRIGGTVRDVTTRQPIAGANNDLAGPSTGADGVYLSPPLTLNRLNQPATFTYRTNAAGYWSKFTTATATVDAVTTADVDLLPICTGATVSGVVLDATNQQPIANAVVLGGNALSRTDANGTYSLTNIQVGFNNAPSDISVSASAPGFIAQTKVVTIFCGATITLDFGRNSTLTGAIAGTVTNLATGQPIAGAFVGADFGVTTATDSSGRYVLAGAPLATNNTARAWNVTVTPSTFAPATQTATVSANVTTQLDFGFGKRTLRGSGLSVAGLAGVPLSAPVATFTDTDLADVAAGFQSTVDWGDGTTSTGTVTGSGGAFTVSGTHTYATAGTFTVLTTLRDVAPSGESATARGTADVSAPSGGGCPGCPVGGPSPSATPELDSLLLFGSGLAGLAGYGSLRWRSRRRNGSGPPM